jgi:hypothetical protein
MRHFIKVENYKGQERPQQAPKKVSLTHLHSRHGKT